MKPKQLDRSSAAKRSFAVRNNLYPNFLKIWHCHAELELVVIRESTGTRFVGNSIQKFEPGEVVLIGKHLPHMWLNDDKYFEEDSTLKAAAYSIHFKEDFLGLPFLGLDSAQPLVGLFKKARRGIRFMDLQFPIVREINALIDEEDAFSKLLKLLTILHQLAKHENTVLLASEGYLNAEVEERADKTHEYIFKNFKQPIRLADVAAIQGMNPSAFSRYFKRIHRKSFSRYLIEIRIGYACKLLVEKNNNVSTACYESGFNNLSNFNKQFLKVMGINPTQYIRSRR